MEFEFWHLEGVKHEAQKKIKGCFGDTGGFGSDIDGSWWLCVLVCVT